MVISRESPGFVRNARNVVFSILLPIYFGLPWLTWNGHPFIRLDIPGRKFYLIGNVFMPLEGQFLFLFLLSLGLSLFFFTSLIGRVWCGWACPQTVFTELFDGIGRFFLGKKYGKKDVTIPEKILLHSVWILISLVGSFSWIAYFAEPYNMISDMRSAAVFTEQAWPYFLLFFAATLYLDMTFVREQFCKYACPYARFQTVMMDAHSINVTYDRNRGEPRRKGTEKIGDCIACNMCVVVCPTGIDIRDGVQIGCIACGKCVDACTKIMGKEKKKTLIGYLTENQVSAKTKEIKWIRPRTVVYGTLLSVVLVTAITLLSFRIPLYMSILPDRNVQPMSIPGNIVRNFYKMKVQNLSLQEQNLNIEVLPGKDSDKFKVLTGEETTLSLSKTERKEIRIILESALKEESKNQQKLLVKIQISDKADPTIRRIQEVPFYLPNSRIN